ncbi:MAG TPA: CPBP family intramembrane glutamic endopeptidase [Ktedonobacterales bacterium]|nr:CPBP family intramembrane glutamic endopeptidase [Ktedonobacterales bacterium]
MRSLIGRVPAVVWTGVLAFLLTVLAGGVWTGLLVANLATTPAIPWAVAVMAVLLWLMWRLLGGWGARRAADARRRSLRAVWLPSRVFAWALAAGVLSIIAVAGLWIVLAQLTRVPARALPDYSAYPALTVALVLLMASLVSSVAEEAGFRGYFQGALERVGAGPLAILVAAMVIAPAHALTQGFVWPVLVFYLCVDSMLGTMAYLTGSIVPGIVVHALGLLVFFTLVWPGDAIRQVVGAGSAHAWLWIHVAQTVLFAALALLAFRQLARATQAVETAAPLANSVAVAGDRRPSQ